MSRDEVKLFYREADEAASVIRERIEGGEKRVWITSHWDADGIASAAIMAKCLHAMNVPFTFRFTKPVGPGDVEELAKSEYEIYVFLDQGGSQLEAIRRHILGKGAEAIVVDHHPGPPIEHQNLVYFNPHLYGLNGGRDISASGATYSIVERINVKFRSLISLAIVGAIGDRQEFPSGFMGVNSELLKRATDLGLIYRGEGIRLVGRTIWPACECIRLSTRPYVTGLSGNVVECMSILESLDIAPKKLLCEIGEEKEAALAAAISKKAGRVSEKDEFKHALWGATYSRTESEIAGPIDIRDYATVLDACGSMKKPEAGFAMAIGSAQQDATNVLKEYQEEMLGVIRWAIGKLPHFKTAENFRYLLAGQEIRPALIGEAISLLIESGLVPVDRPLIAVAEKDGKNVKVSARSTIALSDRGYDLGRALASSAQEVGGHGSGHDVAAAATIPKDRIEEFLGKLDVNLKSARGATA
ncbi:MAG: DHH family phosphoesterase [Candidatus Hadarchaeales archaeon]